MGWYQGDMRTVHHPEVTAPGTSTFSVFIKSPYIFTLLKKIWGHMGWCHGDMRTVYHPEVIAPGWWAPPGTGNHPGLIPIKVVFLSTKFWAIRPSCTTENIWYTRLFLYLTRQFSTTSNFSKPVNYCNASMRCLFGLCLETLRRWFLPVSCCLFMEGSRPNYIVV